MVRLDKRLWIISDEWKYIPLYGFHLKNGIISLENPGCLLFRKPLQEQEERKFDGDEFDFSDRDLITC